MVKSPFIVNIPGELPGLKTPETTTSLSIVPLPSRVSEGLIKSVSSIIISPPSICIFVKSTQESSSTVIVAALALGITAIIPTAAIATTIPPIATLDAILKSFSTSKCFLFLLK